MATPMDGDLSMTLFVLATARLVGAAAGAYLWLRTTIQWQFDRHLRPQTDPRSLRRPVVIPRIRRGRTERPKRFAHQDANTRGPSPFA